MKKTNTLQAENKAYQTPRVSVLEMTAPESLCAASVGGTTEGYIDNPIDWNAAAPSIDWIL